MGGGVAPPAGWDGTLDNLTPDFAATQMGIVAPDLMWNFGAQSSGALEMVAGVHNFTDSGTPLKEQLSAILSGKATEFDSSADKMSLSGNSAADLTAASDIALMWIGNPFGTTANGIYGKRNLNLGYSLDDTGAGSALFRWVVSTSSGNTIRSAAGDIKNSANVVLTNRVVAGASDEANIWTRLGNATGTSVAGDPSSATPLIIGAGIAPGSGSALGEHGVLMIWQGANAAIPKNAHRLLMAQGLSYEP